MGAEPTVLIIAGWDRVYSSAESKRITRLNWFHMPIDFSSSGYNLLLDEFGPEAAAMYGAWTAIIAYATTLPERGVLANSRGAPISWHHISRFCGFPVELIERVGKWAMTPKVGWLKTLREHESEQGKDAQQTPSNGPAVEQKKNVLEERRREETRGEENISSRSVATNGARAPSSLRSSGNMFLERGEPLELSGVDWDAVVGLAEMAAKRIPPKTLADRRAWLKYAVMAWQSFSEAWLAGASESAALSGGVRKTRQALFVRALQVSALERYGTSKDDFDGIFRRIEIPSDVWKSSALKARPI